MTAKLDLHYYLISIENGHLTVRSVSENEDEDTAPLIFTRELDRKKGTGPDDVIVAVVEARVMADCNGEVRMVL